MPGSPTETFQFPMEETMTTETRNIHQRINAVQAELNAIPGTRPVSSGGIRPGRHWATVHWKH